MNLLHFLASRDGAVIFTLLGWTICSLLELSDARNLTTIETRHGQRTLVRPKPPAVTLKSTCEETMQWLPPKMQSKFPVLVQVGRLSVGRAIDINVDI